MTRQRNEFQLMLPRLTGDIMEHLSTDSDTLVRRHPDFPAAYASSDALAIWIIVEKTHFVHQIITIAQTAAERSCLDTMRQKSMPLDKYLQRYTDQVHKLRYLKKCPDEATLCSNFLLSLNGDVYGTHVLELLQDDKVPTTFEETVRHIEDWQETKKVTMRLMGMNTSIAKQPTEELAHSAVARKPAPAANRSGKRPAGKGPGAPTRRPASDAASPRTSQNNSTGCAFCKSKGFSFWKGHQTRDCRKKIAEESAHIAMDEALILCALKTSPEIAHEGVLVLDNAASIHIIRDASLLSSFYDGNPVAVTGVNSREIMSSRYGITHYFGPALYVPTASANLISFSACADRFHRAYDADRNEFVLTALDYTFGHSKLKLMFKCSGKGVYICDMRPLRAAAMSAVTVLPAVPPPGPAVPAPAPRTSPVESPVAAFAAMTVDGVTYTPEQVRRAREVLVLHDVLSHPSDVVLCTALDNGVILNCNLAASDLRNARKIFGAHCAACIMAKMTRPAAAPSLSEPPTAPGQVVHADIVFLLDVKNRKVPYLFTVCGLSGFLICAKMASKVSTQLEMHLLRVVYFYRSHQHTVRTIRSDREHVFDSVRDPLAREGLQLLQTAPEQHEHRIERQVRVIKERFRATLFSLPYTLPRCLYPYLLIHVISSLNMLPNVNTGTRSPGEIVTHRRPDAGAAMRVAFGAIVLTRVANLPVNADLAPRAEHAVVVGRDASSQGRHIKVFLVHSAQVVIRQKFVLFGATPSVIKDMNQYSAADPIPPAEILSDSASLEPAEPPADPSAQSIEHDPELPADETVAEAELSPPAVAHRGDTPVAADDHSRAATPEPAPDAPAAAAAEDAAPSDFPAEADLQPHAVESAPGLTPEPAAVPNHGYNLRSNPRRSTRFESAFHVSVSDAMRDNPVDATAAIEEEMRQMIERNVFEPVYLHTLTPAERKKLIPSSVTMKKKLNTEGVYLKYKGRFVAGGHRQDRSLYEECERSSPTVSLSTVFTLLALVAYQGHHCAAIDITAAYLNASISRHRIHMVISAQVTAILVRAYPHLSAFVSPNGTMVVHMLKALYGLVESSKLWYDHLCITLRDMKWIRSTVDPCMFYQKDPVRPNRYNYMCIYVDDFLIFHHDENDIQLVASSLREKYQKISIQLGPTIEYLGMKIAFDSADGSVRISQPGYIKDIIDRYSVTGTAKTPATPTLFIIDESSPAAVYADFISKVMKLMYLALRSRPDILLPVTFLASRSSSPTEEDDFKLNRVLMYLNGTKDLALTLRPPRDSPLQMYAYVDASYAIHMNARSHTGVVITLGLNGGAIYVHSCKQKLVTKSSFEAELVAVNDALSQIMQIRRLLLEIDAISSPTILFQDNQSTIYVCNHGPGPRNRSRHIDVRYYYVRERIAAGDIVVQYLETKSMLADLLTKPLGGHLFYFFRNGVMLIEL